MKLLKYLALAFLIPTMVAAAVNPSSVWRDAAGFIRPIISGDYIKGLYFTATSTTQASTFPYASSTVFSTDSLCISDDCKSAWPDTDDIIEGSTNFFYTSTRLIADLLSGHDAIFGTATATEICLGGVCATEWPEGTAISTTDDLAEGSTNLYFLASRVWDAITNTVTGLTWDSGTLSLTSGYEIPLTASTTEWNTAYSWGDHALAQYVASSTKGEPYGVASLDSNGTVPISQLPDSILSALEYKGLLDASTGTYPSTPDPGDYYIISVAGTISGTAYDVADWAVYNGTSWDKVDNQQLVYTASNGAQMVGRDVQIKHDPTTSGLATTTGLLSVNYDDSSIGIVAGKLAVKALGITNSMLAGAIDLATKVTGILGLGNGGTGATTAQGARTNILPSQTGHNTHALLSDGTDVYWDEVTGGEGSATGVGVTIVTVPILHTPQTAQTWTAMPVSPTVTELFGNAYNRSKVDLSRAEQYRLVLNQSVAGNTTAYLDVQCSPDNSTWTDANAAGEGRRNVGSTAPTTGVKAGNWADLATGCKQDSYLRIVGVGGSATANPAWRGMVVQFRLNQPTAGTTATSTVALSIAATPQTAQTWSNMPAAATQLFGNLYSVYIIDLTNASRYRIVANQVVAGATGADLNLRYSTDGTTWVAADTGGAGELAVGAGTGVKVGPWTDLVSGAKNNVQVLVVGKDGDGAADPSFRQIQVQFDFEEIVPGGSGSSVWGTITGTLSSQTDLQNALD